MTDARATETPDGEGVERDEAANLDQQGERDIARELRLRPTMPGVTRLSRKVLVGLGAVASLGIGGALVVALQGREANEGPSELYNTERVAQADGLGRLPRDYAGLPRPSGDVPQLGPPLPGDLGPPMLTAQQRGEVVPIPPQPSAPGEPMPAAPPIDPAIERARQEREAATTNQLFLGGDSGGGASAAAQPVTLAATPPVPGDPAPTGPAPGRGERFLTRDVDRHRQRRPRPFTRQSVRAPSRRSDPGRARHGPPFQPAGPSHRSGDRARLRQSDGPAPVDPAGFAAGRQYDAEVDYGQERVLLVWNRLLFPDGRSIVLERQPGADAAGYAGLQDRSSWRRTTSWPAASA